METRVSLCNKTWQKASKKVRNYQEKQWLWSLIRMGIMGTVTTMTSCVRVLRGFLFNAAAAAAAVHCAPLTSCYVCLIQPTVRTNLSRFCSRADPRYRCGTVSCRRRSGTLHYHSHIWSTPRFSSNYFFQQFDITSKHQQKSSLNWRSRRKLLRSSPFLSWWRSVAFTLCPFRSIIGSDGLSGAKICPINGALRLRSGHSRKAKC